MGIPTDPGYELFVGDDCGCWPVGQTPKKLWVSFAGIQCGSLWAPGDPPPPNRIILVEYVTSCQWVKVVGGLEVYFIIQFGFSAVSAVFTSLDFAFDSNPAGICAGRYTSRLAYSGSHYYGGAAVVSQREAI